ncbi:MAG: L,D-transpeptidase [Gammaproteobacteria bacterium]
MKNKLLQLCHILIAASCLGPMPVTSLAASSTQYANLSTTNQYSIEIIKSQKKLLVKQGGRTIRQYEAAVGRGGAGSKRQQGDRITPVGVYTVVDFRKSDQFHYFVQINYPNMVDAWYGYKNNIIDAHEFSAISSAIRNQQEPPQNTALGGYIGIHGIGQTTDEKLLIHSGLDWTQGCIALTNEEIMELRQYVDVGTLIYIRD